MHNSRKNPLRVAILSFAHTHAKAYAEILRDYPGVELLASDPGSHPVEELRGRAFAEELQIDYVDTYQEVFDWKPDGVVIASENAHHRALVELAAAHGVNVLCEKPLATTVEDGQAMLDACRDAGVNLMVAFPVRFSSEFKRLKGTFDAGQLGTLYSVRGSNNGKLPTKRAWFTQPSLSGGGALVDHVVHIADLLDALMGSRATTVTAFTNQKLHSERAQAETAGLVNITYANGVIAAIDCSWSRPDSAPTWGGVKISVAGTNGSADVDFFGPRVQGLESESGRPIEIPYGPNFDSALLDTFLESLRTGVAPQPDGLVGLRTLEIVAAAQESALTGQTVEIAQHAELHTR